MNDVILESGATRTIVDPDVILRAHPVDGFEEIVCGGAILGGEHPAALAVYARWLLQIIALDRHDLHIAHIGGGTCVFPRMCAPYVATQVVVEFRPGIIAYARSRFAHYTWTFIEGDYRTVDWGRSAFDVVAHDVDVTDSAILQSRLAPGGIILRA